MHLNIKEKWKLCKTDFQFAKPILVYVLLSRGKNTGDHTGAKIFVVQVADAHRFDRMVRGGTAQIRWIEIEIDRRRK